MHVCACVHARVRACVRSVRVYGCWRVCVCVCVAVCACAARVHVRALPWRIETHTHKHKHTYTHTHRHTHIHTHTHILTCRTHSIFRADINDGGYLSLLHVFHDVSELNTLLNVRFMFLCVFVV